MLLDIDMVKLIQSSSQKISVEKLVFQDITAVLEMGWGTSNIQEVLKHIEAKQAAQTEDPEEPETSTATYEVHQVEVKNVGVNVRAKGAVGEHLNLDMVAGDVSYKDFNAEVGHSYLNDIVKELLKSLLKTVISNVAGKRAGEYMM